MAKTKSKIAPENKTITAITAETNTTETTEVIMSQEAESQVSTEVQAEVAEVAEVQTEVETSVEEVVQSSDTDVEIVGEEVAEETAEVVAEEDAEPVEYNATKSTDLLNVDPRAIQFDHTENPRTDYGDIEQLKASIKENGVRTPIKVKSAGKDQFGNKIYKLVHGFRRLTAVMALIEEGADIARIPATPVAKGYSETDAIMDHFTENSGKALNALEQAEVFDRLLKFGWEQAEIARKCAVSPSYVSQLMKLALAPKSIKETVRKNQISATLVVKLLTKHKEDYSKVNSEIKSALNKLEGKKGGKVTEKTVTVAKVSKYRKIIDSDIATMQANNYEERYITKAQRIQDFIDSLATLEGEARLEALCAFSID